MTAKEPCENLMTDAITIRTDLRSGDIGRLVAFHGTAYIDENLHFGIKFEAFVAKLIADFVLDDNARGEIFIAERAGELVGCSAMIEQSGKDQTKRGQLRWVLADASVRGTGLGETLVRSAIDYARNQGWREVFLETTPGLDASMGLYKKLGFVETARADAQLWSGKTTVLTMALPL